MLLDHGDPTNYEEAMMSPDSDIWLEAMKSEIGSMYKNKVWTLVDLPDDRQAIKNKWIFKRKTDADGSCQCQNRRISGRGSRTMRLRRMVTGGRGHDVLPRFGPSLWR